MRFSSNLISASLIVAAFGLRFASSGTTLFAYILLAVLALFGRAQVIHALALSWLFTMFNPGLAPPNPGAAIGRYLVLAASLASVILHTGFPLRMPRMRYPVFLTLVVGAAIVLHSVLFSAVVDVSVLKAISWTTAMVAIMAAWSGLEPAKREAVERQLFVGLVAILVVSLPLATMPVGYLVNGTGLQGVLNHPQVFGPTMALVGAWSASSLLREQKPRWTMLLLSTVSIAVVLMSEARTAGLSLVLGVTTAALTVRILSRRSLRSLLPGLWSRRLQVSVLVVALGAVVAAPVLAPRLNAYLAKRSETTSVVEAYDSSRGALIDEMMANIVENPVSGLGFGVASNPAQMEVQRDPVFGIPTGASIEKGVMPIALAEELGLPLAVLVAFWLGHALRRAAASGVTHLTLALTMLLFNFGENTFFSPGGLGLLLLLVFGWSASGTPRVPVPRPAFAERDGAGMQRVAA